MHSAECPHCKSRSTRKDGVYRYKDRALQRYECKACWRKFDEKTGNPFSRLRYAAPIVVLALMLQIQMSLSGSQTRLVVLHLWKLAPDRRTLQRWVTRFHPHVVGLQKRLHPRFTRHWSIDELFANRHAHKSKRKPSPKFLYTVFDSLRQVVACLVSDRRDAESAERVIKLALETAGSTPEIISRDGCGIYEQAKRRLSLRLKGCRWVEAHFKTVLVPVTERVEVRTKRHGSVTRLRRRIVKVTQNPIERYHCTPRARENSMRGVKTSDSGTAYFQALGVAHTLFKPHEAHGGRTPAEAAG